MLFFHDGRYRGLLFQSGSIGRNGTANVLFFLLPRVLALAGHNIARCLIAIQGCFAKTAKSRDRKTVRHIFYSVVTKYYHRFAQVFARILNLTKKLSFRLGQTSENSLLLHKLFRKDVSPDR